MILSFDIFSLSERIISRSRLVQIFPTRDKNFSPSLFFAEQLFIETPPSLSYFPIEMY